MKRPAKRNRFTFLVDTQGVHLSYQLGNDECQREISKREALLLFAILNGVTMRKECEDTKNEARTSKRDHVMLTCPMGVSPNLLCGFE